MTPEALAFSCRLGKQKQMEEHILLLKPTVRQTARERSVPLQREHDAVITLHRARGGRAGVCGPSPAGEGSPLSPQGAPPRPVLPQGLAPTPTRGSSRLSAVGPAMLLCTIDHI